MGTPWTFHLAGRRSCSRWPTVADYAFAARLRGRASCRDMQRAFVFFRVRQWYTEQRESGVVAHELVAGECRRDLFGATEEFFAEPLHSLRCGLLLRPSWSTHSNSADAARRCDQVPRSQS
ncbi:hypothetical protein GCM10027414_19940 [Humibacter ginsengiterrae]